MPIIYACQDGAMKQDYLYCLEVPNENSPIDIDHVIDFYDKIYKGSYDERLETIKYIRNMRKEQ